MRKARIGLILDQGLQDWRVKDFIEKSFDSKSYKIECLIIQNSYEHQSSKPSKLINKYFFQTILFFEKYFVRRYIQTSDFFKNHNIEKINIKKINVNSSISGEDLTREYSEKDLGDIRKENLDLFVNFGASSIKGELLEVSPHGVISMQYGNIDDHKKGPPGFWEVLNKEKTTNFFIQSNFEKLNKECKILFKGSIPTNFFFTLNIIKLYKKSNIFIHKLLEDIFKNKIPKNIDKSISKNHFITIPNISEQTQYILKTSVHLFKKFIRKVKKKKIVWSIGYQFSDDWENVWNSSFKKVDNPKNTYFADPFLFRFRGKDYCFVEHFNFLSNKGHISALEINAEETKFLGTAIDEDFHLSYPNIFQHNDEIYMCPESSAAKDIRLYKCNNFPLDWELEKILIQDIHAVDTNIFRLDGKWWMLSNVDSSKSGEFCSELHLFYSNDLKGNDWKPHPMNPVIFDPKCARNGGMIFQNKELYRVFQVQGWDNYGESFGVSKIIKINEYEYSEEKVFDFSPKLLKKAKGAHTLNSNNGLIVSDCYSFDS